MNHWKSDSGI